MDHLSDPYAALKVKEFRLFTFGKMCFTIALQIQGVIVGWQIYSITQDPLSLGLIGLAEAIPSISVSLFAGHIADNFDRKTIIQIVLSILVLCSIGLFALTLDISKALDIIGIFPIYAIIFISGLARGFLGPAQFALMPQTLPDKSYYANAVSWNSSIWQASAVAGPALGGLIYGFCGIKITYFCNVILMLCALAFISQIVKKAIPEKTEQQNIWDSLSVGIKFIFGNQVILSALALDMFAVLFGGAIGLLPIFAKMLEAGPIGLGFLRAAPAMGSVCMALFLAHNPIRKQAGAKMLLCVGGFGVSMIFFGLSTSFAVSLGLLVLSGAFDAISVVVRQTLIQTRTPENMKGRVSSVNSIFIGSSNEIGSFESGATAKMFGVVTSVVFGGFMTLGVVGITAWRAKDLRKLDL